MGSHHSHINGDEIVRNELHPPALKRSGKPAGAWHLTDSLDSTVLLGWTDYVFGAFGRNNLCKGSLDPEFRADFKSVLRIGSRPAILTQVQKLKKSKVGVLAHKVTVCMQD